MPGFSFTVARVFTWGEGGERGGQTESNQCAGPVDL